jgi:hypothetical protein
MTKPRGKKTGRRKTRNESEMVERTKKGLKPGSTKGAPCPER